MVKLNLKNEKNEELKVFFCEADLETIGTKRFFSVGYQVDVLINEIRNNLINFKPSEVRVLGDMSLEALIAGVKSQDVDNIQPINTEKKEMPTSKEMKKDQFLYNLMLAKDTLIKDEKDKVVMGKIINRLLSPAAELNK